jgi:hypothetical protein
MAASEAACDRGTAALLLPAAGSPPAAMTASDRASMASLTSRRPRTISDRRGDGAWHSCTW